MIFYRNGSEWLGMNPLYQGKEVIVSIDSSKTNSAMFVSDMNGVILDDFEFSSHKSEYVLDACKEQREALRVLFKGSDVKICGIEDIVTKKSKGMDEHMSRFMITAIFMSFIMYFQDSKGITPELINNWTWKHDILPEMYRTTDREKGSLDWHKAMNSQYARRTDDITDAWCILQCLLKKHKIDQFVKIDKPETCVHQYEAFLVPVKYDVAGYTNFGYTNEYDLGIHADVMCNKLKPYSCGVCKVKTSDISISEIYKYSFSGVFGEYNEEVYLVVNRRS